MLAGCYLVQLQRSENIALETFGGSLSDSVNLENGAICDCVCVLHGDTANCFVPTPSQCHLIPVFTPFPLSVSPCPSYCLHSHSHQTSPNLCSCLFLTNCNGTTVHCRLKSHTNDTTAMHNYKYNYWMIQLCHNVLHETTNIQLKNTAISSPLPRYTCICHHRFCCITIELAPLPQ